MVLNIRITKLGSKVHIEIESSDANRVEIDVPRNSGAVAEAIRSAIRKWIDR
jgi:hypothetical protein